MWLYIEFSRLITLVDIKIASKISLKFVWFETTKGVRQGCPLSPCYLRYTHTNVADMDEMIKISGGSVREIYKEIRFFLKCVQFFVGLVDLFIL
jgi:hypothetical protein